MKIFNTSLKKSIVEELQFLDQNYFVFDTPVPFKEGLVLYPVTVRHYNEFLVCSSCCMLNKNKTTEGLMLTNLEFLIHNMEDEQNGKTISAQFSRLMELVFHIKNGYFCKKCKKHFTFLEYLEMLQKSPEFIVCPDCGGEEFSEVLKYYVDQKTHKSEFLINGVVVNSKDFDRLRQIILYQNLPDYVDDSFVNEEIKEDQRKRQEILSKGQQGVSASLEKKIVAVASATGFKIEDIYDYSIRKFLMLLTTVDDMIRYQADRVGLMTGMVSTKTPIEHWIYKKDKSLYEGYRDANEYKASINSAK